MLLYQPLVSPQQQIELIVFGSFSYLLVDFSSSSLLSTLGVLALRSPQQQVNPCLRLVSLLVDYYPVPVLVCCCSLLGYIPSSGDNSSILLNYRKKKNYSFSQSTLAPSLLPKFSPNPSLLPKIFLKSLKLKIFSK